MGLTINQSWRDRTSATSVFFIVRPDLPAKNESRSVGDVPLVHRCSIYTVKTAQELCLPVVLTHWRRKLSVGCYIVYTLTEQLLYNKQQRARALQSIQHVLR